MRFGRESWSQQHHYYYCSSSGITRPQKSKKTKYLNSTSLRFGKTHFMRTFESVKWIKIYRNKLVCAHLIKILEA